MADTVNLDAEAPLLALGDTVAVVAMPPFTLAKFWQVSGSGVINRPGNRDSMVVVDTAGRVFQGRLQGRDADVFASSSSIECGGTNPGMTFNHANGGYLIRRNRERILASQAWVPPAPLTRETPYSCATLGGRWVALVQEAVFGEPRATSIYLLDIGSGSGIDSGARILTSFPSNLSGPYHPIGTPGAGTWASPAKMTSTAEGGFLLTHEFSSSGPVTPMVEYGMPNGGALYRLLLTTPGTDNSAEPPYRPTVSGVLPGPDGSILVARHTGRRVGPEDAASYQVVQVRRGLIGRIEVAPPFRLIGSNGRFAFFCSADGVAPVDYGSYQAAVCIRMLVIRLNPLWG